MLISEFYKLRKGNTIFYVDNFKVVKTRVTSVQRFWGEVSCQGGVWFYSRSAGELFKTEEKARVRALNKLKAFIRDTNNSIKILEGRLVQFKEAKKKLENNK